MRARDNAEVGYIVLQLILMSVQSKLGLTLSRSPKHRTPVSGSQTPVTAQSTPMSSDALSRDALSSDVFSSDAVDEEAEALAFAAAAEAAAAAAAAAHQQALEFAMKDMVSGGDAADSDDEATDNYGAG